jgi:hypothetical protein
MSQQRLPMAVKVKLSYVLLFGVFGAQTRVLISNPEIKRYEVSCPTNSMLKKTQNLEYITVE